MRDRTDRLAQALHRDSIAHALRAWREGSQLFDHPAIAEDRWLYERAIEAVVATLERFSSVTELVAHYVIERTTIDRLAADACLRAAPGRPLLPGVVADAAFWRRCRALVAAAVG
ncbi:MAG TPA: hypothetical protein VG370_12060 [Chloroflexota bacterium]|jgi:hypothetical protein|nr:hypothetical protein [Chloroflexota bacterium]